MQAPRSDRAVVQRQKAVTAYSKSKQLLPFNFEERSGASLDQRRMRGSVTCRERNPP